MGPISLGFSLVLKADSTKPKLSMTMVLWEMDSARAFYADDFIAIGAPNHGVGIDNTGVVYLYHKVGSEYQLMQQLSANELAFDQTFGDHVKLHGNFLFISDRNVVYVYKYDGSQWVFSERLVIDAQEINAVIKIEAENNMIVFLNGYNLLQVYNRVGDNFVFDETIMAGDLEHYAVDFSLSNGELFVLTTGFPIIPATLCSQTSVR
jgi:hypothetical protein